MAPVQLTCPSPVCGKKTDPATEPEIAIQLLHLHVSLVHGMAGKPDKPRRPELKLVGDAVEETDWDYFKFQFSQYKKLANITEDASIHLLECISPDIHRRLFIAYGISLNTQDETTLMSNIRSLVVRQPTSMASIMTVLRMNRESDQPMVNYISELKAATKQCDFTVKCKCERNVNFTDHITMYKLVDGVLDRELQEELLVKADLTLEKAEDIAVEKESEKLSQASMMEDNENKKDDTAGVLNHLFSMDHCNSNLSTSKTSTNIPTSSFERPPSTSSVDSIPVNTDLCVKRNRNRNEKRSRSRSRSRDQYEKRDNKRKHRYDSQEDRKHQRNGQDKDKKDERDNRDSKIERNNRDSKDSKDEHMDKRVERNLKDSRKKSGHRDRKVEKDNSVRDNQARKDERVSRDRKDERDNRDRKDKRESRDRKDERDNKNRKGERDKQDKRGNDKGKDRSNWEGGANGSKDKCDERGNNKSNYDQRSKIGERKKDYRDNRGKDDSFHATAISTENIDPQGKSSSEEHDYRNDNNIPGPYSDYNDDHSDVESPDTSESLEHIKDDHPGVESPDISEFLEHMEDAGSIPSELSIIRVNNQEAIKQLIVQKNIRAKSVILTGKSEQEWVFFMLPPEIQLYIFDLISTKELSILAQTCKALDQLISEVFVFKVILPLSKENQKRLDGRFVLDVTSSVNIRIWKVGQYLGMVKKMKLAKLKRLKFNGNNFGVKREQTKITQYGNYVESFYGLHDWYLDALDHYISHGMNLESIDILIDNSVRFSHLIDTIATLPRLREVTLRSTTDDLQSDPDENPSMTMNKLIEQLLKNRAIIKLTLQGFDRPWGTKSGSSPDTNYEFVIKSKSLEKIRMQYNKCFVIGNIEAENLREIDVESCHNYGTNYMGGLAPLLTIGCPKLERVNKLNIKKLKEDGGDWLEELRNHKGEICDFTCELEYNCSMCNHFAERCWIN